MVFPILKYTNRWGRLTRFDALTTGNVAAFIGRVSPASSSSRQSSSCLYPPWALLIHYENFSKTNEWICCEFQEARHYRRWLRERNQFSSLVRFLFCATRYMTLYRELPIAAEIRWNSADATSTPLLSSSLLFTLLLAWKFLSILRAAILSMYEEEIITRIIDNWKYRATIETKISS